jgi:nucleolar protein 53
LYKQSLIAHVETPHPGSSYNPDYDDHQALLLKAHLVELKKLKDDQKLMRRLAASAKKMSWNDMEVKFN